MMDNSDLKHHDMVPGAIVNLDIWHTWKPLVDAAAMGNVAEVHHYTLCGFTFTNSNGCM